MSEQFKKEVDTKEDTPITDKRDISGLIKNKKEKIEYKSVNLYKADHQKLKFESAKTGRSLVDILSELINEKY